MSDSPRHPISAVIAHRDCHNRMTSERDEWLFPEIKMGPSVPRMRVAVVFRPQDAGRAPGGNAALEGRRARWRAAAARHARIRCLDGRARSGSFEVEDRAA